MQYHVNWLTSEKKEQGVINAKRTIYVKLRFANITNCGHHFRGFDPAKRRDSPINLFSVNTVLAVYGG